MKKVFLIAFPVLLIGCGKQSAPAPAPQSERFGLASSADLNTNSQVDLPSIDFTKQDGTRFQPTEPDPVKAPVSAYEAPVF
jgi:hypothetical protein